jgi:energy-coupling factor transporter ATP-binding protein EcfA2
MLSELSITNFAIIDSLALTFAPGFNVLTGETGAGKSIIIDAVSLLLGGRSDTTMVRSGADAARLEGVFALDPETRESLHPLLEREDLHADDGGEAITLAREIRREGRNVCRVNGRTVSLAILKEIGQCLVDIHGQSEHLSLLRVREHLFLLDRYAGLDSQRAEYAAVVRDLNSVRRELDELIRAERTPPAGWIYSTSRSTKSPRPSSNRAKTRLCSKSASGSPTPKNLLRWPTKPFVQPPRATTRTASPLPRINWGTRCAPSPASPKSIRLSKRTATPPNRSPNNWPNSPATCTATVSPSSSTPSGSIKWKSGST